MLGELTDTDGTVVPASICLSLLRFQYGRPETLCEIWRDLVVESVCRQGCVPNSNLIGQC